MSVPPSPAILAAVDFSPITSAVIAAAMRLAEARDARLVLGHIVVVPPSAMDFNMACADDSPLLVEATAQAERRLAEAAKAVSEVPLETCCRVGVPAVEVCRCAREIGAEFIVVGSHGRGALYELLIGSTTQGILRHAPCPVLVVPAGGSEAAPAAAAG